MRKMMTNEVATTIMCEMQKGDDRRFPLLWIACMQKLELIISLYGYTFNASFDKNDYCSEVMLHVLENSNVFNPEKAGFFTWFSMIAQNVYFKHYKIMKKENRLVYACSINEEGEEENLLEHIVDYKANVEREVMLHESIEILQEELEKLPENQKNTILLCILGDYNHIEATELMHCKAADISRWLHRGTKKLKEIDKDNNISDEIYH